MIIIAVSGWRGFTQHLDRVWIQNEMVFWSDALSMGTCMDTFWRVGDEPEGADSAALQILRGSQFCRYEADWTLPNRAGGPVRSLHMLQGKNHKDAFPGKQADYLLAFPQPGKRLPKHEEVSGTWRCVEMAKKRGITVIIPGYTKPEPERLF